MNKKEKEGCEIMVWPYHWIYETVKKECDKFVHFESYTYFSTKAETRDTYFNLKLSIFLLF